MTNKSVSKSTKSGSGKPSRLSKAALESLVGPATPQTRRVKRQSAQLNIQTRGLKTSSSPIRVKVPLGDRLAVPALVDTMAQLIQQNRSTRRRRTSISSCEEDPEIMELVLAEGIPFTPQLLPKEKRFRRGKLGQCFWNCLARSLEQKLVYVEGFAISCDETPVHHSWCVDSKGLVYEFTWPQPGRAYFGIPIAERAVRDHFGRSAARKWFGPLLEEWLAHDSSATAGWKLNVF